MRNNELGVQLKVKASSKIFLADWLEKYILSQDQNLLNQ